jgi:hypothetical protein
MPTMLESLSATQYRRCSKSSQGWNEVCGSKYVLEAPKKSDNYRKRLTDAIWIPVLLFFQLAMPSST